MLFYAFRFVGSLRCNHTANPKHTCPGAERAASRQLATLSYTHATGTCVKCHLSQAIGDGFSMSLAGWVMILESYL